MGARTGRIVPAGRIGMADAGRGRDERDSSVRDASTAQARSGAQLAYDNRPLLIANFPPQHVAEQAYYRLLNTGAPLPEPPRAVNKATAAAYADMLKGLKSDRDKRSAYQTDLLNDPAKAAPEMAAAAAFKGLIDLLKTPASWAGQLSFDAGDPAAQAARLNDRWKALPDAQHVYLGSHPDAIDPDAREIVGAIWTAYQRRQDELVPPYSNNDRDRLFADRVRQLPDVVLPDDVIDEVTRRSTTSSGMVVEVSKGDLNLAVESEKAKRDDDYARVSSIYCWKAAGIDGAPATYAGRDALRAAYGNLAPNDTARRDAIVRLLGDVLAELRRQQDTEKFLAVTPARLSGPTRLVFRVDSNEQGRVIPFTFEGLTNWGSFDLAVMRRAETPERLLGERLPSAASRAPESDPEKILDFQNIRSGRSIEGRFADIIASLAPPQDGTQPDSPPETAIELPFRLILSPDQFGRFRTRRPIDANVAKAVFSDQKASSIDAHLWFANLDADEGAAKLRAVWSPDFAPKVFGELNQAPRRGPYAPWERAFPEKEQSAFRTTLDAYDRHELVGLSSVYGLPVLGRRSETLNFVDSHQFEPPAAYKLRGLKKYGGSDLSGIYNPQSLTWTELRLTALGGSLSHNTQFAPPAAALREDTPDGRPGAPLFDAFSIERWRQVTVLGRDIEVEVAYKGYLFPLGIRASLIKVSERRFLRNPASGHLTAFLIQRKFIRISEPDKQYPVAGQPNHGVRYQVPLLTFTTLTTPDILDPDADRQQDQPTGKQVAEGNGGRLDVFGTDRTHLSGLVFWPRTRPGQSGNVKFQFTLDRQPIATSMPLIFVDNVAVNKEDVLTAVSAYYNMEIDAALRTVPHYGVSRRYAEETADGECHFETDSWIIGVEGREGKGLSVPISSFTENARFENDPFLEGAEQPPFYPFVELCNIRVGPAERFVGRPLPPQQARYYDPYVKNGGFSADAPTPVPEGYLQLVRSLPLSMGSGGDRSGGLARPEMDMNCISRTHGPVGGPQTPASPAGQAPAAASPLAAAAQPAPTPTRDFDVRSLFNTGAKILGLVNLGEIINLAAGFVPPQLKERVEGATEDVADTVRTKLLPPMASAIDDFDQSWSRANEAVKARTGSTITLDAVYPDIAPALSDLKAKLAAASAASTADLPQRLSEVQQSGRQLVTVIDRTAADPIAPMQEALRDKLRTAVQDLADVALYFQQKLAGLVRDKIKNDLRRNLTQAFQNAEIAKLVFALPAPKDDPAQSPNVPAELQKDLDETVSAGANAFLDKLLNDPNPKLESAQQAAAVAAREKAKAILDTKITAATGQLQTALKSYRDELEAQAGALAEAEVARLVGFAVPTLSDALATLAEIDQAVTSSSRDLLAKIGAQIEAFVGSAAELVMDQAVQRAFSDAAHWCQKQLFAFVQFGKATLPAPTLVDAVVMDASDFAALFNVPAASVAGDLDQLTKIAKSYADAYARLPADEAAAIRACGQLDVAPFQALRSVIQLRRNALLQLQTLYGKLDAAALKDKEPPPDQLTKTRTNIANLLPAVDMALAPVLADLNTIALNSLAKDQAVHDRVAQVQDALQGYIQRLTEAVAAFTQINEKSAVLFAGKIGSAIMAQIGDKLEAVEDRLVDVLAMMVVSAQPLTAANALTFAIAQTLQPAFTGLAAVYAGINDIRRTASDTVYGTSGGSPGVLANILALLGAAKSGAVPGNIFLVPHQPPKENESFVTDRLAEELAQLQRLSANPASADAFVGDVFGLAQAWRSQDPALLRLAHNIGDVMTAVLRGDIAQFVDLRQIRDQVDQAIRQMVPSRIVRSYDLTMPLKPVTPIKFPAERPNPITGGADLVVRATGVVDLLNPSKSTFEARGYLPGFSLDLIPGVFLACTLHFAPSTFFTAPGKGLDLSLKLDNVELGPAVSFLKDLESYLPSPKNGNGFYLRPLDTRPGIAAGYLLALGPLSIGDVYISHLSLNCGAELPFTDFDARFRVGVGAPEAPFMISAAPYAGAGYFGFIANTRSIVGFEASMQYGGGGGFSFGPLTGEGRISVGVYIRCSDGHTTLYGLFYAGGSAQIACFSCSTSLLVRLTQEDGNLSGDATFSFSFSLGIKDIEYSVTVVKSEKGSGGGQKQGWLDPSQGLTRFALAGGGRTRSDGFSAIRMAQNGPSSPSSDGMPKLVNQTTCKGVDYRVYRNYFAYPDRQPAPPKPAAAVSPAAPVPPTPPPAPAAPAAKGAPKAAAKGPQPAPKNAPPPPPPPSTPAATPAATPPPVCPPPLSSSNAAPWLFL